MREYIDGGYKVTEFDSGAIVREVISEPTITELGEQPPTFEQIVMRKLNDIELLQAEAVVGGGMV